MQPEMRPKLGWTILVFRAAILTETIGPPGIRVPQG